MLNHFRNVYTYLLLSVFFLAGATAYSIEIETNSDLRLQFNGYADLEFTYQNGMPNYIYKFSGEKLDDDDDIFEELSDVSQLDQRHLNLLFDAEYNQFRLHVNFESLYAFSTEDEPYTDNDIQLLETYGEYTYSEFFKFRLGKFLAPFGIYNDVRYITPLYATVVLPFIYEVKGSYSGSSITPPPGVAMLTGNYWGDNVNFYYAFYSGMEDKTEQYINTNDVGASFGGRFKLTFNENLTFGFSTYTAAHQDTRVFNTRVFNPLGLNPPVSDPSANMGFFRNRENVIAADFEYLFFDRLRLQSEIAYSHIEGLSDRNSYYARLMYEIDPFTPFILFDSFEDNGDPLFESKVTRLGIGAEYRINNNIYTKLEYDYHLYGDIEIPKHISKNQKMDDEAHMIRASVIVIF